MQPDVSFLVAAYNAAATIERAVASALASRDVSVEVVVADDASSDTTRAVVEAVGDERVRLVTLDRNGGPGAARNAALAAARGRFVAVLDADDTVRPERMARLVARLDGSGADAIVDNLEYVGGDGGDEPRTMFPEGVLGEAEELTLERFVRANRLFAASYNFGYLKPVFRSGFLRDRSLRYPETIRIGEDYLFLAAVLAEGGRCGFCDAVGYTYHITEGSVSRVLTLQHIRRMILCDNVFLARYRLTGKEAEAYRARARSLDDAASFLSVVEAIKARAPMAALGHALRNPLAMRHLRMPLAVRLKGVWRRMHGSSAVADAPAFRSSELS